MASGIQTIIFFFAINLIQANKPLPVLNIPVSDIIIDTNKAFALRRIGIYSSELQEEIIHSFIPLDRPCVTSPNSDICLFTSQSSPINILGLAALLPPHDIVTALPRYDKQQIFDIIKKDISRLLRAHNPSKFISKTNSIIHLIGNQYHTTYSLEKSLVDSTKFLVDNNQSDISRITQEPSSVILRQINNNKIGFDFLTNTELISFLTEIVSIIDKSYQIIDHSEALHFFSQLIAAQSIHILQSCPIRQEHIQTGQPCLLVSTLFLRPLIERKADISVYRLIPLPAIVNGAQFLYSNMPEAIGVNTVNQTVILWKNIPKKNDCLFSFFVYCQRKPLSIPLSSSPCLSQLFNDNSNIVNSCQVTRSYGIQTEIINVNSDLWLFSRNDWPLYCNIRADTGEFNGILSINEPSLIRIPCRSTIQCRNIELPSSTCTNRSVLIRSAATGKYEQLSNIPQSVKNMSNLLLSTYKLIIKNSLDDFLDDVKGNRSTGMNTIKEVGSIVLSVLSLCIMSLIVFFLRWIKRLVLKRIDKLEKDVDDLVYALA